ncbi:MAG: ABC transporter permease, partial [Rhodomicrobium sp.]
MPPKLIALIIKELLSAFRDPRTRVAFIVPPIMQVFLYAYAATLEVTNAPIGVYNEDWGQSSRQLISRFEQASAFSTITYF